MTRVRSIQITQYPGAAPLEFNGTVVSSSASAVGSAPKWKAVTNFGYRSGPLDLSLRWRFIDHMRDVTYVTNAATTTPGVPSYHYFDLTARLRVNDRFTLRGGVNNMFDKSPPVVNGIDGNTDLSLYDALGRAFFLAAHASF